MAIASITTWLDNPQRSYVHGVALYEQYGKNKAILTLIKSGSGSFHLSKLREALAKTNERSNLEPKPIAIPDSVQEPTPPAGKFSPDFTSAPDKILEIRETKNKNYAHARQLFAQIRLMDSKQHRLSAGLQLLDLMDDVNEAWSVIDEWKETDRIREMKMQETEKQVTELTLPELMREAQNLPTYITKDRKKLSSEKKDSKKMIITLRLETRISRLKLVKKRLNELV